MRNWHTSASYTQKLTRSVFMYTYICMFKKKRDELMAQFTAHGTTHSKGRNISGRYFRNQVFFFKYLIAAEISTRCEETLWC